MLRFFLGLTLAQLIIALLVHFSPIASLPEKSMLVAFVIVLLATVITLWFSTVSRHLADQRIAALEQKFANEREKINVSAEKAQTKLIKKTQKEIESQRRKQSTRANLKIGGAVAVATGFGVFMLVSQFFMLGLLTLTTAGGAIGGYLAKSRRDQLTGPDYKLLEGVEVVDNESTPELLTNQSPVDQTAIDTQDLNNSDGKTTDS